MKISNNWCRLCRFGHRFRLFLQMLVIMLFAYDIDDKKINNLEKG